MESRQRGFEGIKEEENKFVFEQGHIQFASDKHMLTLIQTSMQAKNEMNSSMVMQKPR